MKPPELIKKGLEEVAEKGSSAFWALETAPYKNIVGDILLAGDALAYIQQLESRLAQVERERDGRKSEDCRFHTTKCYSGDGCLATKEIDPCKGNGCENWKPKEE